jgi:hypothetical protein
MSLAVQLVGFAHACPVQIDWRAATSKNVHAMLIGCVLLAVSLPASAYEARGARSCEGWRQFRQDEREGYALSSQIYQTWLIGYVSGIVAGSGMDFLTDTDNEVVFRMVDAFCGANPRMNLAAAGIHVARELMQQKGIVNRPTQP